jgi:hypothetical protein
MTKLVNSFSNGGICNKKKKQLMEIAGNGGRMLEHSPLTCPTIWEVMREEIERDKKG